MWPLIFALRDAFIVARRQMSESMCLKSRPNPDPCSDQLSSQVVVESRSSTYHVQSTASLSFVCSLFGNRMLISSHTNETHPSTAKLSRPSNKKVNPRLVNLLSPTSTIHPNHPSGTLFTDWIPYPFQHFKSIPTPTPLPTRYPSLGNLHRNGFMSRPSRPMSEGTMSGTSKLETQRNRPPSLSVKGFGLPVTIPFFLSAVRSCTRGSKLLERTRW